MQIKRMLWRDYKESLNHNHQLSWWLFYAEANKPKQEPENFGFLFFANTLLVRFAAKREKRRIPKKQQQM